MLTLKIEDYGGRYKPMSLRSRKILKCPFCGDEIVYYINSPLRCNNKKDCDMIIPDMAAIMKFERARLAYHFQDDARVTGVAV